jgi:hypothetical protein
MWHTVPPTTPSREAWPTPTSSPHRRTRQVLLLLSTIAFVLVPRLSSGAQGAVAPPDSTSITAGGPSVGRRVGAVIVDAYVGFGTGQFIIGNHDAAGFFAKTEAASVVAFAGGVLLEGGTRSVGLPVVYAAVSAYATLRIWELGDLLAESWNGNASLRAETRRPDATTSARVRLLPLVSGSARGVGLTVSF